MHWVDEYVFTHVVFDIIESSIVVEIVKENVIKDLSKRAIIPNELTFYVLEDWLREFERRNIDA